MVDPVAMREITPATAQAVRDLVNCEDMKGLRLFMAAFGDFDDALAEALEHESRGRGYMTNTDISLYCWIGCSRGNDSAPGLSAAVP